MTELVDREPFNPEYQSDAEIRRHRREETPMAEVTEPRTEACMERALRLLMSLEGVVFAADPKERPMLAQSVVREVARRALGEAPR